jgi:hypothetical protein
MNAIEWSAKAVRQLRKIAEKRKRQSIFAEVQHLANWPDCPGDTNVCKAAMDIGYVSATIG